jgi:DNA-binding MarR family transcriptional regulator
VPRCARAQSLSSFHMENSEHELDLLEYIAQGADRIRQRDLAQIAGLSLGMTNAIVKRLAQKGWLSIQKVNNRNIRYAVSPAGIEQIARRSYRYFKRTIKNIVYYREAIEGLVREVKLRGYRGFILVGSSDLDFIVEHACGIYGMVCVRGKRSAAEASLGKDRLYTLYSESYVPDGTTKRSAEAGAYLQEVVGRRQGVL